MDPAVEWLVDWLRTIFPGPPEAESDEGAASPAAVVFRVLADGPLSICALVYGPDGALATELIRLEWDRLGRFALEVLPLDADTAESASGRLIRNESAGLKDLLDAAAGAGSECDLLLLCPLAFCHELHKLARARDPAGDFIDFLVDALFLTVEHVKKDRLRFEPRPPAVERLRWLLWDFIEGSPESIKAVLHALFPSDGVFVLGFAGDDRLDAMALEISDYAFKLRTLPESRTRNLRGLGLEAAARELGRFVDAERTEVYDAAAYRDLMRFLIRQPTPPSPASLLLTMERSLQFFADYGRSWAMSPAPFFARPWVSTALALLGHGFKPANLNYWSIPRLVERLTLQRVGADGQLGLWLMDGDKPLALLTLKLRDGAPFLLRLEAGDDVGPAAPVAPDAAHALRESRRMLESGLGWVNLLARVQVGFLQRLLHTNWIASLTGAYSVFRLVERELKSGALAADPPGFIESEIKSRGLFRTAAMLRPWFFVKE